MLLYSWNCPKIPKETVYDDAHVSALISALMTFSESILHKNMRNLDLDEGGFMTITGKENLYIVGFFSNGDGLWRAKKLLRTILVKFIRNFENKFTSDLIELSVFNNFDSEIPHLINRTSRKRNLIQSIIIMSFGFLIAFFEMIILLNLSTTYNLSDTLTTIPMSYFLTLTISGILIVSSFASGSPDFRLTLGIEFIRASLLMIIITIFWPESPFYLGDLFWIVYFVLGLTGYFLDRLVFLTDESFKSENVLKEKTNLV